MEKNYDGPTFASDNIPLRNLHIWSWYMKGARDMLLRLRDHYLCDEPRPKGFLKSKDDTIYNKAILDLLLDDPRNTELFLLCDFDTFGFKDHERSKSGKLTKCRAYFTK